MKLVSFSVKNYRSIIEAYKLALGNYTVLVGPNNEGKSNIVKAIALSLSVLTKSRPARRARASPARYYRSDFGFDYEWKRDFPVSLQERQPEGRSEFTLEFELTEDDFQNFREQVGVNLTTNLKVKLGFGHEDVKIEVLMKGRGKKTLNKKRTEISEFIREHVSSQYISALRPSQMALEIVNDLIESELYVLESEPKYISLIEQLQDLQQPILDRIASQLNTTISGFVPGVQDVKITNERLRRAFRTSFNIMVNDGATTQLSAKGDGIISLTTMSLVKHVSEERLGEESLILSIEEPESHLHPQAIHGLRQVLKDISKDQQVIITTHSPILVERERISQNILVRAGRAVKAKQVSEIREALGIHMADNLVGAHVVLLVEGEDDGNIIVSWLRSLSPRIRSALASNILAIDHLAGAANLKHKVTFYKDNVFSIHAFMDNDDEGRRATQNAIDSNVLDQADYTLSKCQGMQNSELEDLMNYSAYFGAINDEFGVNLDQRHFRHARLKWSDRVALVFGDSGKMWDKNLKKRVKRVVVDACVEYGIESLETNRKAPIEALVASLESKIAAHSN